MIDLQRESPAAARGRQTRSKCFWLHLAWHRARVWAQQAPHRAAPRRPGAAGQHGAAHVQVQMCKCRWKAQAISTDSATP